MLLKLLIFMFYFLVVIHPEFNKAVVNPISACTCSDISGEYAIQKSSLSHSYHSKYNNSRLVRSNGDATINTQLKTISIMVKSEKYDLSQANIFLKHQRVKSLMMHNVHSYKGLSHEYKQRYKTQVLIILINNTYPIRC
ncbi:MAG TPA: hypothetical protein VMV32_12120 [Ignavibacteriaceae bacterium]|nr:hypothetical protein [Ignavibacteriaceae bacterium]